MKYYANQELRRVTVYEPPQYDYTDAELHQGDQDNQEEMEEGEL